jgi:hypothetical protein
MGLSQPWLRAAFTALPAFPGRPPGGSGWLDLMSRLYSITRQSQRNTLETLLTIYLLFFENLHSNLGVGSVPGVLKPSCGSISERRWPDRQPRIVDQG